MAGEEISGEIFVDKIVQQYFGDDFESFQDFQDFFQILTTVVASVVLPSLAPLFCLLTQSEPRVVLASRARAFPDFDSGSASFTPCLA